MDGRIIIQSINIKNFRSIKNISLSLKQMNVFVGLNDAGKSNVLKALNLFFNGNTGYDTPFEFENDFSLLFPSKSHQAKEVVIELIISIPDKFKDAGIYSWKKVWRRNEACRESISNEAGEKPSPRSKIPTTLSRIRFRYVPAVKSSEYYKFLLSELYVTAAGALNDPLVESTKDFAEVIRNYTEQIHEEVKDKIGIESRLTIPTDMTEMFKTLVFMTGAQSKDVAIPLNMRGDGIQALHIPILLKYLADKDQNSNSKGIVKTTTIWGYEEPENGIELLRCFELADSFLEYSNQIQMFITTHSPAFYLQDKNNASKVFYVNKSAVGETIISDNPSTPEIDVRMGLMPIVAPYIAKQRAELHELFESINDELLADVPTLFVEGVTDKEIINMAIESLSPKLQEMIEKGRFRIFTSKDKGGCKAIVRWVHSWIYKGNKSKTMSLFDKDNAGKCANDELKESNIFQDSSHNKTVLLPPTKEIKEILQKDIDIEYEIEHLLTEECWNEMIKRGFVQEREDQVLWRMLGRVFNKSSSMLDRVEELLPDKCYHKAIILYEPDDNKKEKIVAMIRNESEEVRTRYLSGLRELVNILEKRFYITDEN